MKNLQKTGTYLEDKAKLHKNISIIFFAIAGIGFLISYLIMNFILLFIFIISLSIGGFFFNKENLVIKNYKEKINFSDGVPINFELLPNP